MSTSLRQQCPVCLVYLTWIVCMMGRKWPDNFTNNWGGGGLMDIKNIKAKDLYLTHKMHS